MVSAVGAVCYDTGSNPNQPNCHVLFFSTSGNMLGTFHEQSPNKGSSRVRRVGVKWR